MANGEISTPDDDVEIGYEFTGSIRCRHLTVLEGGSVTGTAVAHRIDVKGWFDGVADCEYFQALPPAKVRGTVFAPNYHTRDKDGGHADVVVLHSSTRQKVFGLPLTPLPVMDELISTAIDEAIIEKLTTAPAAAPDVPVEAADDDAGGDDRELGLIERLALKGLEPLLPVSRENAAPLPTEPARPAPSGRTPLPSLV